VLGELADANSAGCWCEHHEYICSQEGRDHIPHREEDGEGEAGTVKVLVVRGEGPLVEEVQAEVEGKPRYGDKGLNHPSEANVEVCLDRGRSLHSALGGGEDEEGNLMEFVDIARKNAYKIR
jgi:hypothetical protein